MLKLVFGRAGYGKTYYVRNLLCEYAKQGKDGLCLVVPEQYSFETERAILQNLGTSDARSIEVLGFTRLCDVVFKLFGGKSLPEIDNGTKAVMMRLALDECADSLKLYKNALGNEDFVSSMLGTVEEFKFAGVKPETLFEFSNTTDNINLSVKLKDISIIYSAYELCVNKEYFDPSDKLELLYEKIEQSNYFKGKTVVFDSFMFFSQQQLRIVELAVKQADEVVITFSASGLDDKIPMFKEAVQTALYLISFARKNGVKIMEPLILSEPKRFLSEELKAVETSIFSSRLKSYDAPSENVVLCECHTHYDEADFIARTIINLTREYGYSYGDFAVISREDDICRNTLYSCLDKYSIPFFADRRIPLKYEPLVRFIVYLLNCSILFNTERIFSYLKTGLTCVDLDEIALLENYAYIWNPSGDDWMEDFQMNPDGFSENFTDDKKELLNKINLIRKKAIDPLVKFKTDISFAKNGKDISRIVYNFLKTNEISKNLSKLAGNITKELYYSRVWDETIKLIDSLAFVTADKYLDVKKYLSLFNLDVAVRTVGSIPQHIDEVAIGNAERMRPSAPKVVFIIGANEKVFPKINLNSGLLTDSDRATLINNDIKINDRGFGEMYREYSIAYNSVCAASEKLYVCWSKNSISGEKLYPSSMVTDIKRILPNAVLYNEEQYLLQSGELAAEPIVNKYVALEKQAKSIKNKSVFSDSLLSVLSDDIETKDSIKRMKDIADNSPEFISKETADKMFGGNISLSPTAIESFYKCPFRYFCRYGMNVSVPSVAQIDNKSRGTLVHYCLEHLISDVGSEKLKLMTEKEIYEKVVTLLDRYLETVMGGKKNKTSRFLYNYRMTVVLIKQLAVMIAEEFKQGRFVSAFCELEIGESSSADVKPIKIINPDGTEISVRGFIDRVDVCNDDGRTYIRVIDYKTGLKTLTPTSINNGLNLQMPLYLFTLCKNGEKLFGKERVPAAVLYMHAADKIVSAPRNAPASDINSELVKGSRLSGLFLKDDGVIDAMDTQRKGKHIEISYNKDGSPSKKTSIISIEVMESIEKKINSLLLEMVKELRQGNISADPVDVEKNGDGCTYCDYYSVCRLDKNEAHRQAKYAQTYDFTEKEENDG